MSKPHTMYALIIKKQLLNEIHTATTSFQRLIRKIEHLSDGLPVDIQTLPNDLNDYDFADWYFARIVQYKKFPRLCDNIHAIERDYHELHRLYNTLYTIHATQPKRSWINTILNLNEVKIPSNERKKIAQIHNAFHPLAKRMLSQLNEFEKTLAIQPNDDLLHLI